MSSLDDLLALRDLSVEQAKGYLGGVSLTPITGYGALRDVEALTAKERGLRFVIQDQKVRLVYVGAAALPTGMDNGTLVATFGTGEVLRSRQGRRAELHVVPTAGIAWSEEDGVIGYLELFDPTTFDRYREEIYEEPMPFRQ